MSDEIEFEKNPKCSYCGKEINTDEDEFLMIRDENGKDSYIHVDCYSDKTKKEMKRVVDLGFKDWKSQI